MNKISVALYTEDRWGTQLLTKTEFQVLPSIGHTIVHHHARYKVIDVEFDTDEQYPICIILEAE